MFSEGPREDLMAVGRRVSETDRVCAFVDLTFALGWGQVNKDI